MVHSVELLLDPETESAIRQVWGRLSDMGLRSPGPDSRPHVTLVVAERISPDVDALLRPLGSGMPFDCVLGAPLVFPGASLVLVRVVVPSEQLLAVQVQTHRICLPHATPQPAPNTVPGRWTPHVTLARRVDPSDLARVVTIRKVTRELNARVVGLRRWDGNRRVEHVIDR